MFNCGTVVATNLYIESKTLQVNVFYETNHFYNMRLVITVFIFDKHMIYLNDTTFKLFIIIQLPLAITWLFFSQLKYSLNFK